MRAETFYLSEDRMKMLKKYILVVLILLGSGQAARSQLFKYGIQCGGNYSIYELSEPSFVQVTKGSIGFHSGLFVRRDFENFYIGADVNYTSTLGGTLDDGHSTFNLRTGSVNMPLMFGKKFYPGIRIFAGGMPSVFIKHNDIELQSYLEHSPEIAPAVDGVKLRNDFVFHIMAGAGYEFSKFFIEFRYEHPLDYFVLEDFSTGGTATNVDNRHALYQIVITAGYWFN